MYFDWLNLTGQFLRKLLILNQCSIRYSTIRCNMYNDFRLLSVRNVGHKSSMHNFGQIDVTCITTLDY